MDFVYAGLILLLVVIAVFLGQIAIQFIKLEHKLESTMEILEEELVDVFGSASFKPKEAPQEKPAEPAPPPPPRKPPGKGDDRKPARPEPAKGGGSRLPKKK